MKTRFVLLICSVISCAAAQSATLTYEQAAGVARQWLGTLPHATHIRRAAERLIPASYPSDAFYAFNRTSGGFVIVAADDRASHPILGYSDQGMFDCSSMPENMRWWLSQYAEELSMLASDPNLARQEVAEARRVRAAEADSSRYVEGTHLLSSTWAQGSPYNLLTPISEGVHCATGCVATAWSQILYYHKYPAQAVGEHSYYWGNQQLSTDFSEPYLWDLMRDSYGSSNTDEERHAVARLLSDVGIASDLSYGASSTGGHEYNSLWAMVHFFQYDASADLRYRNYVDAVDWDDMLRRNIDQGLPLYYGGFNSEGGHAFVCDGYEGDMFHFNWGWGGGHDGFFVSSALYSNYNRNQCAIFGIRPDQGGTYRPELMFDGAPTTSNGNQVFRFGTVRAGLYDPIDFEVQMYMHHLESDSIRFFAPERFNNCQYGDNGWGINPVRYTDSLAEGTYRIGLHYRYVGDSLWSDFRYMRGKPHYLTISVDNTGRRTLLTYDGPDDSVEFELEGIRYRLTSEDKKEVVVMKHSYSAREYVIPGYIERNGEQYHVVAVADSAFMGRASVQSVEIGEGIEEIGLAAFSGCSRLTRLVLPASLQKIGNNAFNNCARLFSVRSVAEVPPVLDGSTVFQRTNITKMMLSVPCGLREAYKQVNVWNKMQLFEGEYELTVEVEGQGEVLREAVGCDSVRLIAVAAENHEFEGWSGGETSDTILVVLTEDLTLTATFKSTLSALENTQARMLINRQGNMLTASLDGALISLYSADGRLLMQRQNELHATLSQGIYLLRAGRETVKLIGR